MQLVDEPHAPPRVLLAEDHAELRTADVICSHRLRRLPVPNRRHEVVAGRVLEHVSQCPGFQARLDEHRFGVHRHEHDPSVRIVAADQHGGLDAVHPGHRDVGDNHVRREPLRRVHESVTVLHRSNDVELRSEQLAQPFRSVRVVFGQQHSWAVHVHQPAPAFSFGAASGRRAKVREEGARKTTWPQLVLLGLSGVRGRAFRPQPPSSFSGVPLA